MHNRTREGKGQHFTAHRIAYEVFIGPIPDGQHVCHKCDEKTRVSPRHLFLGTQADNMKDMLEKGRTAKGNAKPNAILNPELVKAIRNAPGSNGEIARKFNLNHRHVSKVRSHQIWKHVT